MDDPSNEIEPAELETPACRTEIKATAGTMGPTTGGYWGEEPVELGPKYEYATCPNCEAWLRRVVADVPSAPWVAAQPDDE